MGLFSKLKEGLTKTRDHITSGMDAIFSGFSSIDDDFYEELEETMIMGGHLAEPDEVSEKAAIRYK